MTTKDLIGILVFCVVLLSVGVGIMLEALYHFTIIVARDDSIWFTAFLIGVIILFSVGIVLLSGDK